MSQSLQRSVMVFAPHPDDDVLACGGTIIKEARQGASIYVVYMTDGRNSHSLGLGITENPTPEEVRQIRRGEAVSACHVLGVPEKNLHFLDFEDGALQTSVPQAVRGISKLLSAVSPWEIYLPSEFDSHPDHAATATAVHQALMVSGVRSICLEYIVWKTRDLPRQEAGLRKRVFVGDVLDLKKRAIYEHKSQATLLFPSQRREVLEPEFLAQFITEYEEFLVHAAE
ncbi:MAG: PIG-L family deacetylase [Chloroflexi bacterium]|nr:PIG-L family deacetylase [Chloroflexota bacterium]